MSYKICFAMNLYCFVSFCSEITLRWSSVEICFAVTLYFTVALVGSAILPRNGVDSRIS